MPELPEVETTRLGVLPHIRNKKVIGVTIRNRQLRWPIPRTLQQKLTGHKITTIQRRAKYLLFITDAGTMIVHLGMSGSLRIVKAGETAGKHDHVDILFTQKKVLRFNDPRRFGCILWTARPPAQHKLLAALGPEPLDKDFSVDYLYALSRQRKVTIKNFIMNSRVVVGIGNIYASEALFMAGIHPRRQAGNISRQGYAGLINAIHEVLNAALLAGGSTLKDFTTPDGQPGYFQHHFKVYGKTKLPCDTCGTAIRQITLGQRASFYCPACQK